MIGTKFYKPLEPDTLTRIVMREVTREVTEQKPVYDENGMVIEYKPVTKTVTEEVPEQETYDNPAPNTYTHYLEAAHWCNANGALMEDKGEWYEVCAIPEPTAEELAEAELSKAKTERAAAVAAITVEVDGMVFDGDEIAQERMARTVTAATATGASMDDTTVWVLHDNSVATPTIRQLATALRLAGEEQTRLWTIPYESKEESYYTPAEAA